MNIPGIEFHSGSLGHMLGVSAGIAIDCKIKNAKNKIAVMVGDGELNEGSNWESILLANANKLDNILVIVDRNKFQANLKTEDLVPIEPLDKKFESFGCGVKRISGHDFNAIEEALDVFPFEKDRVSVLIADTIRGKGIPSIEERADKWFFKTTSTEAASLLKELKDNYITQRVR